MTITGSLQFLLKLFNAPDPVILSAIGFVYPATPMASRDGFDFYSYEKPWSISYYANQENIGTLEFDTFYLLKGKSHRTRMAYYYYLFRSVYKNSKIIDENLSLLLCHEPVIKSRYAFVARASHAVINFKLATSEHAHAVSCHN